MSSLIEIMQARIIKVSSGDKDFLHPEIRLKRMFRGPGEMAPVAPTLEGVVTIALADAKRLDVDRGVTFIQDYNAPAYQSNGPWNFSPAAHQRHGLTKTD